MNRKKTKTDVPKLVDTLNKQYCAIQRNLLNIKTAADTENDYEFAAYSKHAKVLDAAFNKTLDALRSVGETVKFDGGKGEFFTGANKYRIEFRVESVGYIEIDAPTEQIALAKAEKMADLDKIDLTRVNGNLKLVTEAV